MLRGLAADCPWEPHQGRWCHIKEFPAIYMCTVGSHLQLSANIKKLLTSGKLNKQLTRLALQLFLVKVFKLYSFQT